MGETLTVSVDTSKDVQQPSLEELAAKMDEANPPSESVEERPEWLPEKFKSAEDLAKAYSELEKKLGSKTAEIPPKEGAEASTEAQDGNSEEAEGEDTPNEEAAREASEKAGLDFDALSAKYWEKGDIDESDYKALEKAGIPQSIVQSFIAGQEALLDATRQSVFKTVGGEENYNSMTGWAADNLDAAEIAAYNKAVNSGQMDVAMMAVKGLKARYDAEVGYEPARTVTATGAKASASVYRSIAELEKDMGDPRYKNDPAFRKDVERKLGRSDIF